MWFDDYIDKDGYITLDLDKAIDVLLEGGNINNFTIKSNADTKKYNLYSKTKCNVEHQNLLWNVPKNYLDINVRDFFNNFKTDNKQTTRINQELDLFESRNLFIILKLMIYLVDFMKKNNIIWGVGRGSSVSSYLLYLIGVHKVDSLKYNLDIKEFIK